MTHDPASTIGGIRHLSRLRPFQLGNLLATPGALRVLTKLGIDPMELIRRHQSCDWGDLSAEDRAQNDVALIHGSRLFSSYSLSPAVGHTAEPCVIWCITEAVGDDGKARSCTTLLTPREY